MPDLAVIYDPELLVPSQVDELNLEFWVRLDTWSRDPRPRIGPATMQRFYDLMAASVEGSGISRSDFWQIASRLASRGISAVAPTTRLSSSHVRDHYRPHLGHADNLALLVHDVSASGSPGLAIATDARCWPEDGFVHECGDCDPLRLHPLTSPNASLAPAARAEWSSGATPSIASFATVAPQLFPSIEFADSAWSRLGSLAGDSRDTARSLMKHLTVLNDQTTRIWREYSQTPDRQQHLASLGVEASPESPNIRAQKSQMSARTFEFGIGNVICEWHTKLLPHTGRIYFAVREDKVCVGLIVDHP